MSFKEALKTRDFVVTGQVNLGDARDAAALVTQAQTLSAAVDAVQLIDGRQPHISGIAAAALLLREGIDPIVQINTRDRNRLALQKDVIGAAALGVSSILVTRGTKIAGSRELGIRNVHDTTPREVMAYIRGLSQADDEILPDGMRIGAGAELFAPARDWTPKNLARKCEDGANFVQLQLCFDMDATRQYMARIVASKLPHRANFIVSLSPLPSGVAARWVRDNVKGALVPDHIIERLENATDPEAEGVAICAGMLRECAEIPGVSGANLVTLGELDSIPVAIAAAGLER